MQKGHLRHFNTLSGEATSAFSCLPSKWRSTPKGKNLLLQEQILSLRVDSFVGFLLQRGQKEVKVASLCKHG